MTQRSEVRPLAVPFTDDDVREITRAVLLPLCSAMGPTRVAKALTETDERTVRRARDEQTTLCMDTMANLLRLDPLAFDGFLTRVGRRSVPVQAVCDTDALPALTGAVHKLVVAASPTSDEGAKISKGELLDAEDEIRAAYEALDGLLGKIEYLRAGGGA
jgi:hypothetical protein